jgi:N-methylhydantoinase B
MEKYGRETVIGATEKLSEYTEARLRQVIASWPDGKYEGEACVDHDGIELDKPVRIHVTVEKVGADILFDFSQSSSQTAGPANIRPPLVRACCYYCLVALIDPFLPINQGLPRVVKTRFREGSVVCPTYPAAVNTYMPTALVVAEAIFQAMGALVPEKRIAEGSGSGAIALGGQAKSHGRGYVQYEIFAGGVGGRTGRDGPAATSFHLSNGKIAPIEIIESEFPTRVERFELVPDSGGAGQFRGGLGFVREYRILQDEVRFSMRTDKHDVAPQGIGGGQKGLTGACIINPGEPAEKRMPSRFGDHRLANGDVLRVERPGGGGVGNPVERDPEAVLRDVRNGYVSIASAERDYRVAIERRESGPVLDTAETQRLRG